MKFVFEKIKLPLVAAKAGAMIPFLKCRFVCSIACASLSGTQVIDMAGYMVMHMLEII